MTDVYAVRLPAGDAGRLGRLRTVAGLEVHEDAEGIWLRARDPDETLQNSLRSLPGKSYRVLEDGQLCETGSRIPLGFIPKGAWHSLSNWLEVELPACLLSGVAQDPIPLKLVSSADVREPNLLLTSLEAWSAYGARAPQVRLDNWRFAVSSAGDVLVRGLPLPPLPGLRLVETRGIAVPGGRAWSPAVDAGVLAVHCGLSSDDVLLWLDEHRRERVSADMFVRATRSAIRHSTSQS